MANDAKAEKPKKRNKVKEVFSELKKVTWPTFGKVVKQTGTVLIVTIFFMLVLLAMDQLLSLAHGELVKGLGETAENLSAMVNSLGTNLKTVFSAPTMTLLF